MTIKDQRDTPRTEADRCPKCGAAIFLAGVTYSVVAAEAALPEPGPPPCPVCEGWGAYCPEHKP